MKFPETSRRITEAMTEAGLKANELAQKSGVGKSSISHYVRGTNQPNNINAGKIAAVLNVSPQWLMGFDVEKRPEVSYILQIGESKQLFRLTEKCKQLNGDGLNELIMYADKLLKIEEYTKKNTLPEE